MNKITTNGISINALLGLILLLFISVQNVSSQETYTSIRKNVNPLALNLSHNLSNTQDTLLLENKALFKRVRFIGKKAEKVFDFKPAVKKAKIPLNELPLGKYMVMFYQADKIIVFEINRILPFDLFDGLESDVALNNKFDMKSSELNPIDFESETSTFDTLASNTITSEYTDGIEDTYKPYNLSDLDRELVQSRADYRRNHLRPNGKPYTD
ncbi:hypothetical protein AB9K26_01910 [Psychroserpens sp. XS_ASV72]|uniref:hypothetical protein n=1 Tax=Psychroserpens sp. XS_ASV72 TaxID=3241293 RepID=UPI0035127F59